MANRFLSNIKINDAYTFPASDGSNGQVIVTDGSGNLSFANPAASSSASVIYRDNFTGDGSTTVFYLQNSLSDEDQTQIYIDGVYQEKGTYSVSNNAITFSTAPVTGHSIEVISISGINVGPTTIYQDNFTGDGSTVAFTMAQSVDNEVKTMIYFNGVYQFKGTYTLNGSLLTFDAAPANGVAIEVISIASAAAADYNQKMLFYGKATEAISKGDAVMFAGAQGDHFLFSKATQLAIQGSHELFIGLASQDLVTNEYGYVTEFGKVTEIDTSAYEAGDILWFDSAGGTAGALTDVEPAAPLTKIQVAAVIRSHANEGVLFVRPTWYHELGELHDVKLTTVADKDLLVWNDTNSYWENSKTIDTLSANTLTATTLAGTLSTAAQTNVTSVGTLSSLAVSGTLTVDTDTLYVDSASNEVGIGTSNPAAKLHVVGEQIIIDRTSGDPFIEFYTSGSSNNISLYGGSSTGFRVFTAGSERMRIDYSSGNVGIGVVPSSWSLGKVIEISGGPSILGLSNSTQISNNAYYNSGWIYKATSFAQNFVLDNDGSFKFNQAVSGTAGNSISFTQAMTLNASGNLSIGNTNDTYKLDVSGVIRANGGSILVTGVANNWLQSTQSGTSAHFQTWYASNGTTRRGYFGYGSGGSDNFTLMNEANGQLVIGTNSISALTISSTGAVGIGTTSPNNRLTVAWTDPNVLSLYRDLDVNAVGPAGMYINMGARYGSSFKDGARIIGVLDNSSTGSLFIETLRSNTMTSAVAILGNGNVGIGATNPIDKLYVAGDIRTPYGSAFKASYDNSNDFYHGSLEWAALQLGNNGGNRIVAGRTSGGGSLSFYTNNTNNAADYDTTPDGILTMHLSSAGNVGIGTTSPSYKLDVSGSSAGLNFSGGNNRIYFNGARAIEGNGTSLQIGEGHATTYIQTSTNSTVMTITSDKVGIGVTNPTYPLDLGNGGTGNSIRARRIWANGTGTDSGFSLNSTLIFEDSSNNFIITNPGSYPNASFCINTSGNVGIGTTSNLYGKLSVEATGNHITMRAPGATAGKYWALDVSSANQFYLINNAGTQYLTMTDSGNVGIGKSPSVKLDVAGRISAAGTDFHTFSVADGAAQIKLERTNSSTGANYIGADNRGLSVYNSSFGVLSTFTSNGITFNGDTAAANALDDYEEGTWTPTLRGSSSAGSYSLSIGSARYTKIGRLVTLSAWFSITVNSAGSGYAVIGNVPFSKVSGAHFIGNIETRGNDYDNSIMQTCILFTSSGATTDLYISGQRDAASALDVSITGFSTGNEVFLTIQYEV